MTSSSDHEERCAEIPVGPLLFISYAYEDSVFAKWLARKLAFHGYGVWIDQIKILGGESWVEEVDVAIRERSFRVLGLLSQASSNKPNPRKERTLALQLSKERGIADFLITLNLDGVQPDWTMSDISYLPFMDGWAKGFRRLLKKLRSIDAPRIHDGNPAIAKAELDTGEALVSTTPEKVVTNWLVFDQLPQSIKVYNVEDVSKEQEKASHDSWPCYVLESGRKASFVGPPSELRGLVRMTKRAFHWPGCEKIDKWPTHDVVSCLLSRTIHCALLRAGCTFSGPAKSYCMPAKIGDDEICRFTDIDGQNTYIRTSGIIHIPRPGEPPETVIYRPSLKTRVRFVPPFTFVVQLRPSVMVFDAHGNLTTGNRVGPRVKRVTKYWWNDKWRKRLLAFEGLLLKGLMDSEAPEFSKGTLLRISADRSLNEEALTGPPADDFNGNEPLEDADE